MAAPPSIWLMRLRMILGAAVVGFQGSADFDGASSKAADVANIFQVV